MAHAFQYEQKGGVILENKFYILHVGPNCCRNSIPKLHILINVAYKLVAWPQKNLTVTLKSGEKIVGQTFLKSATGANVFFDFLNHKNEEIMPKK